MYYNGRDYKNLQEYVEVGLGLHPTEVDMTKEENWRPLLDAFFDYQSYMGEFTEEDLGYIKKADKEIYYNLGQYVDHYEVQIWSDPNGEIDYCNDYFSWEAAYDGYRQALKDGYEYVRIVSVDPDGLPDGKIDKFSW